jgi:DNA polymerase-3 subunit chi
MTEALFYHLETASLESVLPDLLEKTLQRGWKAVVRAGNRARIDALDEHLWTWRDDSFLPHAAGGDAELAARQPVWLTDGADVPNNANVLFAVDRAAISVDELSRFERCVVIFDGADAQAVAEARAFWKSAAAAGAEATYWKQSVSGRWEKQA